MAEDGFRGRHAVGRQLHDERRVVTLHQEAAEEARHDDGQNDAQAVDAQQHQAGMLGEEDAHQQEVERQTGTARHQGIDEDGHQPTLAVLDGARSHDGRHVASEAHDERDERLAVEAHLVHDLVHDEGGAGHVARVFHQRNEQVEYQDVGQEDDDAPHTADDAVDEQILQRTFGHVVANEGAERIHQALNPSLRIGSQHEGDFEHQEHEEEEDGESPDAVRHDGVDDPRHVLLVLMVVHERLAQGAGDESVFGIGDGLLAVLVQHLADALLFAVAHFQYLVAVGQALHHALQVLVVLQ